MRFAAMAFLMVMLNSMRAQVQGFDAPSIRPDSSVTYRLNGSADERLDLYLPAPRRRGFATIVFTYGGGWHAPRSAQVAQICEFFRTTGYACVLVAHRLSPANPYPAAEQDEAAAVAWVLDHISGFGGNLARVALVGHSSGAHLALLIASDPRWLRAEGHRPQEIAAVVGLSTPTDLRQAPDGRGFGDALMGGAGAAAFSRDTQTLRIASPVTYAGGVIAPVLLVVGANDFPMLERDARAFAGARRDAAGTVDLLVAPGLDHMGTVSSLVEPSNPVQARVLAFLAEHLTPRNPPGG